MNAGAASRGQLTRAAAWLGIGMLFVAVAMQKLWSADTWTLLAIGRWVVGHRGVPSVEEWTWTGAGHEWIELRWLFCVPMYLAYERIGAWAPSVLGAGLVGLTFVAAAWPSRRVFGHPAAALIVALGLIAGMTRWVMRPELVTYAMVAVFLVGLERAAEKGEPGEEPPGTRKKLAWAALLILLQIVWTNTHALFVFGPVLAWTWVGGEAVWWGWNELHKPANAQTARSGVGLRSCGRLALLACAISWACWLNPYFTRGAMLPLVLFEESRRGGVLSANIEELRSVFGVPLAAWRWDVWAAVALLGVAIGSFAANWRRFDPARAVALAMAVYLAAGAQRNVGLLAVIAVWAGLRSLEEATRRSARGTWGGSGAAANVGIGVACAVFAWYAATDRYWARVGAPREFGLGVVESNTPKGAADFVLAAGAKGRLYNAFGEGGYLIWRLEGKLPVYVDGRTEVHDPAFWEEYFGAPTESWSEKADRLGINTAIVPRKGYEWLVRGLTKLPGWALVYADARDTVFVREMPEHRALIANYRRDPAELGL